MTVLNTAIVLQQIDAILHTPLNRQAIVSSELLGYSPSVIAESISRLANTIDNLAPSNSGYKVSAQKILIQYGISSPFTVQLLVGVLKALREDYVAGYLIRVEELVHADIFSDFLEMPSICCLRAIKIPPR